MISDSNIRKFDEAHVIEMYESGKTFKEISNLLGTGYNQLHQYFILKGVGARRAVRRDKLREKAPKGAVYGMWTVVSDEVKSGRQLGNSDRALYWLVQCKCGNLAWKSSAHLKDGTSTRCKKCGNKAYFTESGDVDLNALILSKFTQVREGLKTRKKTGKLEFSITPVDIKNLYEKQSHKCELSGIDISLDLSKTLQKQNLSIDRIDSSTGYTKDNIQLVDKRINMMKGTLSNSEFISLCCKVAEHHGWSRCS